MVGTVCIDETTTKLEKRGTVGSNHSDDWRAVTARLSGTGGSGAGKWAGGGGTGNGLIGRRYRAGKAKIFNKLNISKS